MSKIHGAGRVATQQAESPQLQGKADPVQQGSQSVYRANTDSHSEKFSAREGIERAGRGRANGHKNAHAHGHHGKHRGDEIDIDVEGIKQKGRVLAETEDTLVVIVGDEVFIIDKKSGDSRSNRRATASEIQEAEQMQQMQQQQQQQEVQAQERRSEAVTENIKTDNRKYDAKLVERKKEVKIDEAKTLERGTTKKITKEAVRLEHNRSVSAQFQMYTPDVLHVSLSVSEIIFSKGQEEKLKKS